jgi:hypothetical protein
MIKRATSAAKTEVDTTPVDGVNLDPSTVLTTECLVLVIKSLDRVRLHSLDRVPSSCCALPFLDR